MIHFFQIGDCRLKIQLEQLLIFTPACLLYLTYFAVFIHNISKGNRIGRAGLLAGRLNFTIVDVPPPVFGQIFHLPDPMMTESTFFHHAFAPD